MGRAATEEFPAIWVYVRAGNMDNTMLDTQDLAIIRGSSLTWLRAPEIVFDRLKGAVISTPPYNTAIAGNEKIYVAASEGVFRFDIASEGQTDDADSLEQRKKEALAEKRATPKRDRTSRNTLQTEIEDLSRRINTLRETLLAGRKLAIDPDMVRAFLANHAAEVIQNKQDWQGESFPLDLFTFSIVVRPDCSEWTPDLMNALRAEAVAQQLGQADFIAPPAPTLLAQDAQSVVCAFDRVSPAAEGTIIKGKVASSRADQRHRIGRRQKQLFYAVELQALHDDAASTKQEKDMAKGVLEKLAPQTGRYRFAQDFSEILAPDDLRHRLPAALQGKFCVIAIDGNDFGRKVTELTKHPEITMAALSAWLLWRRRVLLAAMLEEVLSFHTAFGSDDMTAQDEEDADADNARVIPFETLLWGGDEMQLVCPAWMGFALMARLQRELTGAHWTYDAKDGFSHSAGMLFAGYKTPIQSLREAAGELCDEAKAKSVPSLYPSTNLVQVEAIEGGDFADLSVRARRGQLLSGRCQMVDFCLPSTSASDTQTFDALLASWATVKTHIGKGGLHDMLHAVMTSKDPNEMRTTYARRRSLLEEMPELGRDEAQKIADAAFGTMPPHGTELPPQNVARLVQLTTLYDYFDAHEMVTAALPAQLEAAQ